MTDTPLKERKDTLGLKSWVRELRTLFSKNASSAEVRRWLLRLRKEVAEHENHDAEGVTLQLFGDLTDLAVSRGLLPVISTYFIDNIAYRFYPKDEVRENRARRDARAARNRAGRGAHLGCSYSKS
ncbi:hypothetical protein FRC03_006239 [Tulasnella sp. 419]|nr:hypothetical protein FRC03_006239 [Tulasnella sp. 419]